MLFKLFFTTSRGKEIELYGRPFGLISVEGIGDVGADVQMQYAPFQDGGTYIDAVMQPRYITITMQVFGTNGQETQDRRREIASVFNPKLGPGVLRYECGDSVRLIDAVAEKVPAFPDGVGNRRDTYQKGIINLICPNPFWRSPEVTEEAAFEPLFEFPSIPYWEEGDDGDLYFQVGMQRNDRVIDNDGDAPAPFRIDFYGPADSPIIKNETTDQFIQINKRLEEGQTMKVNTADGTVIYVDEYGVESDQFAHLDLGSQFFDLQIGENDITCNCAVSNNQKDFDIYYSKLYNAV